MVSGAGPMPLHVTYAFPPAPGRHARIRIRVRGEAGGFYRLAAPAMARKVRSSLVKDLRDLERRLLG
ncbi:hypothetical protein [Streptomyces sp. ISL-44]|uniref:hypothetical protein n=1 Tax=Streptomyces sp. ISL-44 TaxID=2819184 RepID=UPI0027E2F533|nr:hypothetical protein [Streptomyces sp. ISL-44]